MRRYRFVLAVGLAVMLLVVASPALAFDGVLPDGKVVWGEDFTLRGGESVDGDLIVFGGNVELEEDSRVEGNVIVWGGNIEIAGTVEGDVAVFGGNVDLLDEAVIEGDVAVGGGSIDRDDGAVVEGQLITNPENVWDIPSFPGIVTFPTSPVIVQQGPGHILFGILGTVLRTVAMVVVMAGLAGLIVLLWPQPTARVGETCVRAPLASFGVGLLTVVIVAALLISICLTIVGVVAGIAAGVAAVFGWAALGIIIGERLLARSSVNPFWTAVLGTGLLTFISALLDVIPCVGWIAGFLVMCVGLGAVILTRFGSSVYVPNAPAPRPRPLQPEPVDEPLEVVEEEAVEEAEAEPAAAKPRRKKKAKAD